MVFIVYVNYCVFLNCASLTYLLILSSSQFIKILLYQFLLLFRDVLLKCGCLLNIHITRKNIIELLLLHITFLPYAHLVIDRAYSYINIAVNLPVIAQNSKLA